MTALGIVILLVVIFDAGFVTGAWWNGDRHIKYEPRQDGGKDE